VRAPWNFTLHISINTLLTRNLTSDAVKKTPLSTSFPLDDLLAALRAKDIEHDASQIVEDLNIKGWHIHKGVSTNYSIVRSF
jgi:hypothetical protein